MDVDVPTKVVIADDHAPTRRVVRRALEGDGFDVCAEVANAVDAVQATRDTFPAAALLDVRMPGNGIRAAETIHREQPQVTVVMLTISSDEADLFAALAAGASGYWLKGHDPAVIPSLIRRAMADESVLPGTLVKHLVKNWRAHDVRHRSSELVSGVRFSSRERQVIELLDQGFTTSEIARTLFITPATVRTHISSISHKLRVKARPEILDRLRRPTSDDVP